MLPMAVTRQQVTCWMAGVTHWIWLPGFLLGIAAAIVNVYRMAKKFIK